MFNVGDLVLVKQRKGHSALLAPIISVSGDSITIQRPDGAIRTYLNKNVTLITHAAREEHDYESLT